MKTSEPANCILVKWAPSRNSAAANLTLLAMTAAYAILGANPGNLAVLTLIGLLAVPVLSVGIPVFWVTQVDKQPISALGLTLRKWLPSLALSVVLSLVVVFPLLLGGATLTSMAWMPMAAAGALSLFEPLFVFGWLQLRFEKDFGILPGIILAGLGFAVYHAGYMPQAMQYQFYDAVLWAVCFRLTLNLLVTWPILWATTSAWVCLGGGGCIYNWSMVVTWGLMLLIEIAYIAFMASRQRRREEKTIHAHAT